MHPLDVLSHRTITRHHLLILLGRLLIPLLTAICLLWVVFNRPDWLEPIPDTKDRLLLRGIQFLYAARLRLPALDSDGDGAVDWLETARGSDPYSAASHPHLWLSVHTTKDIFRGQRTHFHYPMACYGMTTRWPADFQADVTADSPILLKPGSNDAPTAGPLRATITPEGELAFDVLCSDESSTALDRGIKIISTRSGRVLNNSRWTLFFCYGWRLPARPFTQEIVITDDQDLLLRPIGKDVFDVFVLFGPPPPRVRLRWDPLPYRIDYLIEEARADRPDEWSICSHRHGSQGLPPEYIPEFKSGPLGGNQVPFVYRVIPIAKQRPETTSQ